MSRLPRLRLRDRLNGSDPGLLASGVRPVHHPHLHRVDPGLGDRPGNQGVMGNGRQDGDRLAGDASVLRPGGRRHVLRRGQGRGSGHDRRHLPAHSRGPRDHPAAGHNRVDFSNVNDASEVVVVKQNPELGREPRTPEEVRSEIVNGTTDQESAQRMTTGSMA